MKVCNDTDIVFTIEEAKMLAECFQKALDGIGESNRVLLIAVKRGKEELIRREEDFKHESTGH